MDRETPSRQIYVVVKRRRYDTVELVAEIRRERRNGIILALAGIGILVVLLGLYVSGLGDEKLPTAPGAAEESATPAPAAGEPTVGGTGAETAAPVQDEAAGETEELEAGEPEKPAVVPKTTATLQIVVTKKSTLWVDGEKIGKVKKHVVELEPGEHEIKAKLGKKLVTQKLAPKAGATYMLRFDAKRKKAVLKKK